MRLKSFDAALTKMEVRREVQLSARREEMRQSTKVQASRPMSVNTMYKGSAFRRRKLPTKSPASSFSKKSTSPKKVIRDIGLRQKKRNMTAMEEFMHELEEIKILKNLIWNRIKEENEDLIIKGENAAVQVQKIIRGKLARQQTSRMREKYAKRKRKEEAVQASIRIQCCFRQRTAREVLLQKQNGTKNVSKSENKPSTLQSPTCQTVVVDVVPSPSTDPVEEKDSRQEKIHDFHAVEEIPSIHEVKENPCEVVSSDEELEDEGNGLAGLLQFANERRASMQVESKEEEDSSSEMESIEEKSEQGLLSPQSTVADGVSVEKSQGDYVYEEDEFEDLDEIEI